jgi:ribosomal protein L11 methyltransferase
VPVVEVVVDAADAELAADALWQAGPSAVSEQADEEGRVRLVADVADLGLLAPRWGAQMIEPDQAADLDAWRPWARPRRAGQRILLQPAWLPVEGAAPDDLVVLLDPGRSFGSGSHASTRLAVAALEAEARAGDRVLDVGCGSGVLSVAACLLGARSATAVDLEPGAVDATQENARANGVDELLHASTTPLEAVPGTFDVVVANISGSALRSLAGALQPRVAPGGRVILSGFLDAQVDAVVAAYPWAAERGRASLEGWGSVILEVR